MAGTPENTVEKIERIKAHCPLVNAVLDETKLKLNPSLYLEDFEKAFLRTTNGIRNSQFAGIGLDLAIAPEMSEARALGAFKTEDPNTQQNLARIIVLMGFEIGNEDDLQVMKPEIFDSMFVRTLFNTVKTDLGEGSSTYYYPYIKPVRAWLDWGIKFGDHFREQITREDTSGPSDLNQLDPAFKTFLAGLDLS